MQTAIPLISCIQQRSRLFLAAVATSALCCIALPTELSAQGAIYFKEGHGDIRAEFHGGGHPHLHVGWKLDDHDHDHEEDDHDDDEHGHNELLHPDEVIAWTNTLYESPSRGFSALYAALGTENLYGIGSNTHPPNLGFSLEGFDEAEWLNGEITLTLTGITGPGNVALSKSSFGGTLFFSNVSDATLDDNTLTFLLGGHPHEHLDWWFTEIGTYDFTFEWSGTYIGPTGILNTPVSGSGTFSVEVAAIPEPGTWALLAAGTIGLLYSRRKRRIA